MNNKQHVHIEAAVVSLLVVALLGFIDRFIDVYDGHTYKTFGYLAVFFVCYAIATAVFRKLWN